VRPPEEEGHYTYIVEKVVRHRSFADQSIWRSRIVSSMNRMQSEDLRSVHILMTESEKGWCKLRYFYLTCHNNRLSRLPLH
jgi:hypothetical protein